jgi:general secretion pathway protein J
VAGATRHPPDRTADHSSEYGINNGRAILMVSLRNSRRRLGAGFTLVEMLIAIVILGLLMTSAFGALRLGGKSWEQGIRYADNTEALRSSSDFMRRQFTQLQPLSWHDGERTVIAFSGNASSVRFVSPAPAALDSAGLLLMTLSINSGKESTTVSIGTGIIDPGSDSWFSAAPSRQNTVLTGLESATLEYFGKIDDQDRLAWHSNWPQEAIYYPRAVRLSTSTPEFLSAIPTFYFPIYAGADQ